VKELWRDGKGRGLSELVGWVRYLSQFWREFVPERRDSYGYGTANVIVIVGLIVTNKECDRICDCKCN